MRRQVLFVTTAIITFLLGLTAFRATLGIESLLDRFWTEPTIDSKMDPSSSGEMVDEQAETNEVYQAVIGDAFVRNGVKLLVLDARTTGCNFYENEDGTFTRPNADFVKTAKKLMPNADSATLEDYFIKNRTPEDLRVADLGVEYHLISNYEVVRMFSGCHGGWAYFYERYPKSRGLTYLSRVGFNPQHDQALVYLANSCGGLCGEGSYVLLRKYGTIWLVEQRIGLWVS